MARIRIYADTSVFGGVFDEDFSDASREFFAQIRQGDFSLVTSAIVQREIQSAPQEIKSLFAEMLELADLVEITEEALSLRDAYLEAKILTEKSSDDALHVALATTAGCSMIVSWNFRHIVHFDKISLYNAVNTLNGHDKIDIFSPFEVIRYENKKV